MKIRVALLVRSENQLVVMERHRDGEHYLVLPGGGVEPGEDLVDTARREAVEELGLFVDPGPIVADLVAIEPEGKRRHVVVVADDPGGPVALGDGPERALQTEHNRYRPRRIGLDELRASDRRPIEVFEALERPGGPLAPEISG